MPLYTDQIGKTIELISIPQKIISIVPSQTELLYHLGLNEEVTGITKFCIHPEDWFKTKQRVGGTKALHIETIKSLQPHLIIANKEENVKEQVEELAEYFPIWTSDINNLDGAVEMILSIGEIVSKKKEAKAIIKNIKEGFAQLQSADNYRVCYLIWKDPYMTVGGDTFINNMLQHCGYVNVFDHQDRYPMIDVQTIKDQKPDLIFLSSEPYPFKQKHIDELEVEFPNTKILLVDGEMFSWYGSRLQFAPEYFRQLQQQIKSL